MKEMLEEVKRSHMHVRKNGATENYCQCNKSHAHRDTETTHSHTYKHLPSHTRLPSKAALISRISQLQTAEPISPLVFVVNVAQNLVSSLGILQTDWISLKQNGNSLEMLQFMRAFRYVAQFWLIMYLPPRSFLQTRATREYTALPQLIYSTACSRKKKYTKSPMSKEPTKLGSGRGERKREREGLGNLIN